MTSELDKRIGKRIDAIARGRVGNRDDLHEHVLAELEARATSGSVTEAELDAAFATLGPDDAIRASFFAPRTRLVPAWAMAAYVAAAACASAAILLSGHSDPCNAPVVFDACTGARAGGELDLLVFGLPPLVVLGTHFLRRPWLPMLTATVWAVFFALPSVIGTGGWGRIAIPVAGVITLATPIVLRLRGRQ